MTQYSHFLDLSLFRRNKQYGLIYLGQFVSLLGTMVSTVVMPYQVYHSTKSTVMVGMLSLVQLLPLLFTALIGGVLADKHSRRLLLIGSELFLAVCCFVLYLNALPSQPNIAIIFIVSALMSATTGLHRPAFEGVIQQIVKSADYKTVGGLRSFMYSTCCIIGPSIAGLLLAHLDIALTYLIDFSSFFVSIVTLLILRRLPKPSQQDNAGIWRSLRDGIAFAWNREVLLGSYAVDFIAMVFAIPNALFPAMALQLGGVQYLGFLYSAPSVGSLFIAFFIGWTQQIQFEGRAIAISAILWGISIVGFGCAHSIYVALFFLILSGIFDTCSGIFRGSLWNMLIPADYRGRLAGIEMLSYLSGPKIGDARAGLLAAGVGIEQAIISGGILCIIGVIGCCFRFKKLWTYDCDHEMSS